MGDSQQLQTFPDDWQRAVVFVAHPDDPAYGMAAAVNRWTREGKRVDYVLATSGEAGIEGMPPEEAGPVREDEQRRSAAVVGVDDVDFLGFTDSEIVNSPELRAAITREVQQRHPDVVLTLYRGAEWAPGAPNQSDHMELGNAVVQAISESDADPLMFENGPEPTHRVNVTKDDAESAVRSLAQHDKYLSVLDPDTPVEKQARDQVEMTINEDGGQRFVGLAQIT